MARLLAYGSWSAGMISVGMINVGMIGVGMIGVGMIGVGMIGVGMIGVRSYDCVGSDSIFECFASMLAVLDLSLSGLV